jgi:hypothetical protein
VTAVASGLAAQGLKRGDRVGVYGANCVEWMLALQVRYWFWFCWFCRRAGRAFGRAHSRFLSFSL